MEVNLSNDFLLLLKFAVLIAGGPGRCTGLPRERCSGLYSLLAMIGMPLKSAFTDFIFLNPFLISAAVKAGQLFCFAMMLWSRKSCLVLPLCEIVSNQVDDPFFALMQWTPKLQQQQGAE
jgi:hypothetical protein